MKREELVAKVAENVQLTKKQANMALTTVLEEITNALGRGESVTFVGFGTFRVATRKARTGVNPKTREPLQIPECKVPTFKAGTKLKEAVR